MRVPQQKAPTTCFSIKNFFLFRRRLGVVVRAIGAPPPLFSEMASRRRFLAAAASAYCASAFGAYCISKRLRGENDASSSGRRDVGNGDDGDVVDDLSNSSSPPSSSAATFSRLAPGYDRAIDTDETLMGLKLLRRLTLAGGIFGGPGAEGDVLEACAGTGRNLAYYSRGGGVSSVTLADPSREMLAEARQKAMKLSEDGGGGGGSDFPRINFVLARAEALVSPGESESGGESEKKKSERVFGPNDAVDLSSKKTSSASSSSLTSTLPPLPSPGRLAPRSFDTVVDTFGLCSVEDPRRALEEMAAACKPNGKIILIEHGRATTAAGGDAAAAAPSGPPSSSCPSPPPPPNSPPPPSPPFPLTAPWIDAKLDASAAEHRRKWGCWWNRDLEAEIRRVVDVESVARWHFGTTLVVVARPRVVAAKEEEEG